MTIKPALTLVLPLLALAACNDSREADDVAARPTADITASDAAAAGATMVPPVGSAGTPADQTIPGAIPSQEPSSIPGATNTAAGKGGATDAGRTGVNRSTGTNASGANRPNAGATSEAIRKE